MGIGIFLKSFLPLTLYLLGVSCSLIAMCGKVRYALFLLTLLLPLRNFIDKIQSFPMGDQLIDILLFGLLIGWIVNAGAEKRKFIERSSINTAATILIIYMTISLLWGDIYLYGGLHFNIHNSRVQDWKNFTLLPLIFFVYLNNVRNTKEAKQILVIMCVSIFIASYYTATQISSFSSLVSREKISGTFQFLGPNEVAAFFNTSVVILISLFYVLRKSLWKLILLGIILASLYCIAFTYSRAAYMGLIAGLSILFFFKDKKLFVPLILLLLFWQMVLPEKVIERIKGTQTETGELDQSSQRRIDIWEQALDLFKSSPVLGIGYGVFRYQGLDLKDTHNIYIKILSEQGLVGFIIFLFLIFSFMKEGFVLYQKGDDDLAKGLGLGFFITIFVVLINNFFGDRWSYLEPNAYLWIFAALTARLNSQNNKEIFIKNLAKKSLSLGKPLTNNIKKKKRYYDPE